MSGARVSAALEGLVDLARPLERLFSNPDVYEIQIQPSGDVYGLWRGRGPEKVDGLLLDASDVGLMLAYASSCSGGRYDESTDYFLACQLPAAAPFERARLHAMLGVVSGGALVAIRKHPTRSYDLEEDYRSKGILSAGQVAYLRERMARARSNMLVAGSTGSGKTQLVNALLRDVGQRFPERRMGLIEDVPELVLPTVRSFRLETAILAPPRDRPEVGQQVVTLTDLIPHCLRVTPDSLTLGELRIDTAARALLAAWETGHNGGLTTIHANSALQGLERLRNLARSEGEGLQVEDRIGGTIETVVHIRRLAPEAGADEARFRASVHQLRVEGSQFLLEEVV